MVLSKIKKHFSILLIRLNQKRELEKIYKEKNRVLNSIIESFLEIKFKKNLNNYSAEFQKCEDHRNSLLVDNRIIAYDIFGSNQKSLVKDICKKASSTPIWGRFLFLIIKKIKSPKILEIGTNLGVSGSYILSALKNKKNTRFITMEGVPDLCKIANTHFDSINPSKNHQIIQGIYKNSFPKIINKKINFNLFFIDGNHNREDTLHYFNALKSVSEIPTIMIFDDINWSIGMKECWSIIKEDKTITYSIDFFKWGIIIITKSQPKFYSSFKLHLDY